MQLQHISQLTTFLLCIFLFLKSADSFIVPQELPTILSLVYSNIPPIKKGTDSRLGFGFRLGEHADFQFITELGPQKATKPLGDQDSSENSFNKRQIDKEQKLAEINKQRKLEIKQKLESQKNLNKSNNWLEIWSQELSGSTSKSTNEQDQQSMINAKAMKQLQLLYKLATTEPTEISTSTTKSKKQITKELMDIRLDDDE